ncbi:MAG: hypothetical protein JST00_42730 [Deltaproteobacteria bacterium]|nr:hypothetical protein [Deltaproteobacteria bacterium]
MKKSLSRDFHRDERGGIAVAGIFMSAFLTGAVFYSSSMSHTVNHRDGLQQTADAAAFSEAVVSARGMNMISSMNVIMVALSAVELPVRVMKPSYEKVAAMPCFDICTCQIVADAQRASTQLSAISQQVEQRVGDMLNGLSEAQIAIAQTAPKLGGQSANKAARDNPEFLKQPQASIYSSSLSRQGCRPGLPVQDDEFTQVCKRAKKYTPELAMKLADETLDTMKGACKSGPLAMADASPKFPSVDQPQFCTEARRPACGGGPHPKKVVQGGSNGSDHMQFWSRVNGEASRDASHAIDNFQGKNPRDVKGASNVGFAQSEVYFDCTGTFSTCNREEQAMYDARWLARLRRVKKPTISFANDQVVKTEIADEQRWSQARQQLLGERRSFYSTGPTTPAGALLSSANEGPLQ